MSYNLNGKGVDIFPLTNKIYNAKSGFKNPPLVPSMVAGAVNGQLILNKNQDLSDIRINPFSDFATFAYSEGGLPDTDYATNIGDLQYRDANQLLWYISELEILNYINIHSSRGFTSGVSVTSMHFHKIDNVVYLVICIDGAVPNFNPLILFIDVSSGIIVKNIELEVNRNYQRHYGIIMPYSEEEFYYLLITNKGGLWDRVDYIVNVRTSTVGTYTTLARRHGYIAEPTDTVGQIGFIHSYKLGTDYYCTLMSDTNPKLGIGFSPNLDGSRETTFRVPFIDDVDNGLLNKLVTTPGQKNPVQVSYNYFYCIKEHKIVDPTDNKEAVLNPSFIVYKREDLLTQFRRLDKMERGYLPTSQD